MSRRIRLLSSFVVVLAAVFLFVKCSSTANPSVTIKGYATAPSRAHLLTPLTGTRLSSCDGGTNNCCTGGTGCNPAQMNVTLYKVWLSTNTDCTNGVLVADNGATPTAQDVTQNPTLITGSPADGTYHCVILKMSDTMSFKINQTALTNLSGGSCNSLTTTYNFDVFRTGATYWDYDSGATMAGAGSKGAPSAQAISLYFSTDPTAVTTANASVSVDQVGPLGSSLTIAAATPATYGLVLDFSDQVENQAGGGGSTAACWMAGASITFVKL